jgi:hypothetical protein
MNAYAQTIRVAVTAITNWWFLWAQRFDNPISYAGGEFAELNIGLMPGLVSSYKQGGAWKQAQVTPRPATTS